MAYDVSSNLIRTMNPLGQINTSVFDLANRVVAQIDPLGNRTSFAYDGAWNMIRTTEPAWFHHDQRVRQRKPPGRRRRSAVEPHQL